MWRGRGADICISLLILLLDLGGGVGVYGLDLTSSTPLPPQGWAQLSSSLCWCHCFSDQYWLMLDAAHVARVQMLVVVLGQVWAYLPTPSILRWGIQISQPLEFFAVLTFPAPWCQVPMSYVGTPMKLWLPNKLFFPAKLCVPSTVFCTSVSYVPGSLRSVKDIGC